MFQQNTIPTDKYISKKLNIHVSTSLGTYKGKNINELIKII